MMLTVPYTDSQYMYRNKLEQKSAKGGITTENEIKVAIELGKNYKQDLKTVTKINMQNFPIRVTKLHYFPE